MPNKFNELLLKPDIIELYNEGITPDYGYLLNGRFEKDMVKTLYPLKTLSGNPISWEASDTEYLFPVVSLEPKQAGSGDPRPENVRPISGYDSVTVNVRGKNLIGNFGEETFTTAGVTWTIENDRISAQGETGEYFSTTYPIFGIRFPVPPASYSISYKITDNNINLVCGFFKSDNTVLGYLNNNKSYTLTEHNAYVRIYAQTLPNKVVNGTISDIQFEVGPTPTDYEPYQPGTTATITLPETIYGGTVDALTGVGSKTWGYIASYNGESLPGEWISDRDVYASGTTPTTGAQVAYKLATPEPFQATGNQQLTSLLGYNTIYTNGDSMVINRKARRLEV